VWRRSRATRGVDSHDVGALRSAVRRARVLRTGLVVLAVGLLAAAAASANNLDTRERGLLPTRATGVVVLDLSLSIADEDYSRVRRVLRRLIEQDAPVGLVVFSDVPYELFPPGTPASEMRSMLRLLVAPDLGPPVNPWTGSFRAGTRISSALELARQILERDRVTNGAILLVSDLESAPDDIPRLARVIEELRGASIDLRVYPLSPSTDSRLLFAGLLEERAFVAPLDPDDTAPVPSEARSRVPVTLLVLGGLVFLALALHERFGGRLALPQLQRTR
jgi:hypothetical protein